MLVISAEIYKMLVRIANRKQSVLGLHCLYGPLCKQLVFEILEHLLYQYIVYIKVYSKISFYKVTLYRICASLKNGLLEKSLSIKCTSKTARKTAGKITQVP